MNGTKGTCLGLSTLACTAEIGSLKQSLLLTRRTIVGDPKTQAHLIPRSPCPIGRVGG